jgi:nitrate reductase gamma subunit
MYDFVRGPLVWIALIVFFGGLVIRLAWMVHTIKKDKTVLPSISTRFSLRSILHWMLPFGSQSMRSKPFFSGLSYLFHVCLLTLPLLVAGHAVLWQASWGFSWWSLPPLVADIMTAIVILAGVVFTLRRIMAPEVRNVNTWRDYVVLGITIAPFITGFIAYHQWLPYRMIIILHMVSGALWLMAIPFTWLQHMFMFFFSRAYMGSEFGAVRNARDW